MKRFKTYFVILLLISLFIISCSDDSSTEPNDNVGELQEPYTGYWAANQDIANDLNSRNETFGQIEATLMQSRGRDVNDEVSEYVSTFVSQSEAAGESFQNLLDLENQIVTYGDDRGMFTDAAGAICKGIYNTGKKVVVSSGQMVRSGWRVLSGSHSIREAIMAPDSGIPIVSDFAQTMHNHMAQRDTSIRQSIISGDNQEGYVDLGALQGDTPEERANYYTNLSDDHPVKKGMRGNVHLWDTEEKNRTVTTLKDAAKKGVKIYSSTVGGDMVTEITEQMVDPGQTPTDTGQINRDIRTATSNGNNPVTESKTLIIAKRNQSEDDPKIAVITDVPEDFELEIPTGQYDFIFAAEEYVRSLAEDVLLEMGEISDDVMMMYRYSNYHLIVENLIASPEAAYMDEPVTLNVQAASLIGSPLNFDWDISGSYEDLTDQGGYWTFVPTETGNYTINLTVTDNFENSKSVSTSIEVADIMIDPYVFDITSENFLDEMINPGENVDILFHIRNNDINSVSGTMHFEGSNGVTVTSTPQQITISGSGGEISYPFNMELIPTFSEQEAEVVMIFEVDLPGREPFIIEQPLGLDVNFYCEIDPISSPVVNRILNVTGKVANPLLTEATLVIDNDFDRIFDINISNGFFNSSVIVEPSVDETDHIIELFATSGSLEATDLKNFSSQVEPAGFRVTLTWDTNATDVDLWVTDPNDEKCYYAHPTTASGLTLDFDDTDGFGPENITSEEPMSGDYIVQVHYYSDHDDDNAISTNCQIIIRLNEGTDDEEVYYYYGYLADTGDIWAVTTFNINGEARVSDSPINEYSRILSETLPAK